MLHAHPAVAERRKPPPFGEGFGFNAGGEPNRAAQVCGAGPPMVKGLGCSRTGPPLLQLVGGGGSRLVITASIWGASMVSYCSSSLAIVCSLSRFCVSSVRERS